VITSKEVISNEEVEDDSESEVSIQSEPTENEILEKKIDDLLSSYIKDSDNEDSGEDNVFISSMAEEGEEDTPSEGSNDIVEVGEEINTTESEFTTDEESYDKNSFIDDDDHNGLLSGEEFDLSAEKPEKTRKKSRIIKLDSESDDDVITIKRPEKKRKEKPKKSRIIKPEDSSDEEVDVEENTTDADKKTESVNSKDDVIEIDQSEGDGDQEEAPQEVILKEEVLRETISDSERKHNLSQKIIIHENIRVQDIQSKRLSDRIQEVVTLFCSEIKSKEGVSLNVSLDYTGKKSAENLDNASGISTPKSEIKVKDEEKKKESARRKKNRKRKRSLSKSLMVPETSMEIKKTKKPKFDEVSLASSPNTDLSETMKAFKKKTKKKKKDSSNTVTETLEPTLDDDVEEKVSRSSKKKKNSSNTVIETLETTLDDDVEEKVSRSSKKNKKQKESISSDDILEEFTHAVKQVPVERVTEKVKKSKKRKHHPASESDVKIQQESEKTEDPVPSKKMKKAKKITKVSESPEDSTKGVVESALLDQKRKRKIEKSSNVPIFDGDWEVKNITIAPSAGNNMSKSKMFKGLKCSTSENVSSWKKFHPKDFKNAMVFDPDRNKRVDTKTSLKKRGAYF